MSRTLHHHSTFSTSVSLRTRKSPLRIGLDLSPRRHCPPHESGSDLVVVDSTTATVTSRVPSPPLEPSVQRQREVHSHATPYSFPRWWPSTPWFNHDLTSSSSSVFSSSSFVPHFSLQDSSAINLDGTNNTSCPRILLSVVSWALSVPAFQSLSSHDQQILLEESLLELLVLTTIQLRGNNSLESVESFLKQYLTITEHHKLDELMKCVASIHPPLNQLELTSLKALLLFRPGWLP